jgi:hypothetical protein
VANRIALGIKLTLGAGVLLGGWFGCHPSVSSETPNWLVRAGAGSVGDGGVAGHGRSAGGVSAGDGTSGGGTGSVDDAGRPSGEAGAGGTGEQAAEAGAGSKTEGGASGHSSGHGAGDGQAGGEGGRNEMGNAGAGDGSAQGPWTPLNLAGLTLWLDAGQNVIETTDHAGNAKVSQWRDLSSSHNDASQASLPNRPTRLPSAANGRPGIYFDGLRSSLNVPDSESLRFGAGDFTVMLVAAFENDVVQTETYYGHAILLCKHQIPWPFTGVCLIANYDVGAGLEGYFAAQVDVRHQAFSVSNRLNDNALRLYGVQRRHNAVLEARVNREHQPSSTINELDADAFGEPLFIGGDGSGYQALLGVIAEVVVVRGTLSPSELAELEHHLTQKYQL